MTSLTCPKCRHGLPDAALDAGQCPLCGFPLDGPVVLATPVSRTSGTRLPLAVGATLLLTTAGAGFAVFGGLGAPRTRPAVEIAAAPSVEPISVPERQVAPFPHEPQRPDANPSTPPVGPPGVPGDLAPPPGPVVVEPPKKVAPRPIGVVMKVDPRIAPKRHFDHPDDTAALPDLNSGDRVTLTGKVRVLRLGSVNGKGVLDASGLVAEEIVITGDLNNESQVLLNAPNGTVTVGGYVTGASKLTIAAPGGEVTVAGSGRVSGGALVTVTAKRLEIKCPLSGNARANVTLTAPGALKLGLMEEGATVTYKKSAANDPAPTIEKGNIRGGAKVIAGN
jgi:hypothetical protein